MLKVPHPYDPCRIACNGHVPLKRFRSHRTRPDYLIVPDFGLSRKNDTIPY